jgi:Thiamine pyrophosphate enzyme, N-terminal TPP binding domain
MPSKTAVEALIDRLAEWGVDTIFGLPGDGINGIMEGLRRNEGRVRFVLVHHEEAATPTHPRPRAPDTPPGNRLLGPVAALFDKARDAIKGI